MATDAPLASQYHHFIPRLILREFAEEKPSIKTKIRQNSKKQRNKQKPHHKDGVLHLVRTHDGSCGESFLSRHYGLTDMYRETISSDQFLLEKKLSALEARAGQVLARARKTFVQPDAILTLTRTEKDCLRRFLFIMKYRNSTFHERYNVATIEEYRGPDKEKLRKYMASRNFASPREVWCANLHAFLDVHMDPQRNWQRDLPGNAYEEDIGMFLFHVDHSYVAFCSPQDVEDEFILTENAYEVFEGADSTTVSTASRIVNQKITFEWHNFAPISSSLIIILRSNIMPNSLPFEAFNIMAEIQASIMRQLFPEPVVSALIDLPIERCEASYLPARASMPVSYGHNPSSNDRYEFRCFKLSRHHMEMINTEFLNQAPPNSTIVYRRAAAAARSVRAYLEDPRPTLKILNGHDCPRAHYLCSLKKALEHLESGHIPVNVISRQSPCVDQAFPLDYADHHIRWMAFRVGEEMSKNDELMQLYRDLGGSTAEDQNRQKTQWTKDVEQAGLIAWMHTKIEVELNKLRLDRDAKFKCREVLRNHIHTLAPRHIWLYEKVMHNLEKFNSNNSKVRDGRMECSGEEDEWARKYVAVKMLCVKLGQLVQTVYTV